ncbi:hypothetical protein [Leptolyngbya sp. O-77]|uniref:hypothetical protein n=1 Tax=Leptolyngbya sp. O-77 TaxID=1080068 RepID=UPI000B2C38E1|nr:hypothetical protein [Leptolyngbya sp. O-77]
MIFGEGAVGEQVIDGDAKEAIAIHPELHLDAIAPWRARWVEAGNGAGAVGCRSAASPGPCPPVTRGDKAIALKEDFRRGGVCAQFAND